MLSNKVTGSPKINHTDLKEILPIYMESDVPILLIGKPGIGKSDAMKEFVLNKNIDAIKRNFKSNKKLIDSIKNMDSEKLNNLVIEMKDKLPETERFSLIDIRLSLYDSSDLKGIPVKHEEEIEINGKLENKMMVRFAQLGILPPSNSKENYIVFLDEMNQAPPMVQSAAFQLILDKSIGDYTLPKNAYIIAAGNALEDNSTAFEMSKPLKNRFAHFEMKIPSIEEWTEWAIQNNMENSIVSFLQFKNTALYPSELDVVKKKQKNDDNEFHDDESINAFATPRTWHFLDKAMKSIREQNPEILNEPEGLFKKIVSSNIGQLNANLFIAFIKKANSFSEKDILNDFYKFWKEKTKTTEDRYAALNLVLDRITPEEEHKDDSKDFKEKIELSNKVLSSFFRMFEASKNEKNLISDNLREYTAFFLRNMKLHPQRERILSSREFAEANLNNKNFHEMLKVVKD